MQHAFATYLAMVAEAEVAKDGEVRVRRVVCAVDRGIPVNPNRIAAQIQSAVMFGITAALYGEITFKAGKVEQSSFDSYQMLRIDEAPVGMGEAGTSATVPAMANTIFAATGKRLRKMPIDGSVLKLPG